MGNSLSFPSILVNDVYTSKKEKQLDPREPLIGDGLSFDQFSDADVLVYDLSVIAARPELAKFKARSYARAKNPFEPGLVHVSDNYRIEEEKNLMMSKYRITVTVTK